MDLIDVDFHLSHIYHTERKKKIEKALTFLPEVVALTSSYVSQQNYHLEI